MSNEYHRLYRELISCKATSAKWKRELDDILREKFENRNRLTARETELKELIKETELIKQNALKDALIKQKELDEAIQNEISKEKTTKGQKMLLLHLLGALDSLDGLKISQGNKIKLLTYIVGATEKNIERDFNRRNHPNSTLKNKSNYSFLLDVSKKLEIKEFETKAKNTLDIIYKKG